MGLDKDDSTPPVDMRKRTTKVNISIAIAVIAFFVITALVIWRLSENPPGSSAESGALP
ncbi:MAG TPA: hypothetical protein VEQ65_14525 [Opitutus sp.]|nr:hypothetical protein [Opitutus sp.]